MADGVEFLWHRISWSRMFFGAGSAEGPLELGGSKKILDLGSRAVSRNSGNIYKL